VGESARIAAKCLKASGHHLPILPYAWYRYHPGEPHGLQVSILFFLSIFVYNITPSSLLQFLDPLDMWVEFDYGATTTTLAGMIIWGDESKNKSVAKETESFLTKNKQFFSNSNVTQPPATPPPPPSSSSSVSSSASRRRHGHAHAALTRQADRVIERTRQLQRSDDFAAAGFPFPPFRSCSL